MHFSSGTWPTKAALTSVPFIVPVQGSTGPPPGPSTTCWGLYYAGPTPVAYNFISSQMTIQAGKGASNFHYQPQKSYQQSLNSKLNQLRKDSNCLPCPQRHEQALNMIQRRLWVKEWDPRYFNCLSRCWWGSISVDQRLCGLIHAHLRKIKSVLEKVCAFPGSETFGSGVHTPQQHCLPPWDCVHNFLGVPILALG